MGTWAVLVQSSLSVCGGAVAAVWSFVVQDLPLSDTMKLILGPLGSLVFAMVTIYALVKYIRHKEKIFQETQQKYLEEIQKEKDYWRDLALKNDDKKN